MKKRSFILVMMMILTFVLAGCGQQPSESDAGEKAGDLTGKSLHIYCGAGMTNPFQEIADAFKEKTGCEINVTFANAGQSQAQISASKEGDIFIAGSVEELDPVSEFVSERKDLVKHIPVLAVAAGNPKSIDGLPALVNQDMRLVIGDPESTPIGKIAKKALSDLGILNTVNIIATTTTSPQLATAVSEGEADATIVWKENCTAEDIEIVSTNDLEKYIKTVPAAVLTFTTDKETVDAFMTYLGTEEAKRIWAKYGYENLE